MIKHYTEKNNETNSLKALISKWLLIPSLVTKPILISSMSLLLFNVFLCFSSHLSANTISLLPDAKCKSTNLLPDYPLFGLKTIVIDAGHGGHDPGCIGGHTHEKKITLAIAKLLGAKIKEVYPHINVIQTRTDDTFVPLHERAAIANRNKADLFISIHCNYMPGSAATKGSETYVMGLHKAEHNLNVAKRENASILLEADYEQNYDYDPNSPEGHILLSMVQNAYLEQSILFAQAVEDKFHANKRKSRGVKQAGFVVLKETTMPSVLIEVGFLSNKSEEAYLMGKEGQLEVSTAVVAALTHYKQKIEGDDVVAVSEPGFKWNEPANQKDQWTPKGTTKTMGQKEAPSYAATPSQPKVIGTPIVTHPSALNKEVKNNGVDLTDPKMLEYTLQKERRITVVEHRPKPKEVVAPQQPLYYPGSHTSQENSWTPPPTAKQHTQQQSNKDKSSAQPRLTAKGGETRTNHARIPSAGVLFKVQLMASPQPVNTQTATWQRLDYGVEVVNEKGLFKYMIHTVNSYEAARNAQLEVRQIGFKDAFLVAYKNGQRISLDEAFVQ